MLVSSSIVSESAAFSAKLQGKSEMGFFHPYLSPPRTTHVLQCDAACYWLPPCSHCCDGLWLSETWNDDDWYKKEVHDRASQKHMNTSAVYVPFCTLLLCTMEPVSYENWQLIHPMLWSPHCVPNKNGACRTYSHSPKQISSGSFAPSRRVWNSTDIPAHHVYLYLEIVMQPVYMCTLFPLVSHTCSNPILSPFTLSFGPTGPWHDCTYFQCVCSKTGSLYLMHTLQWAHVPHTCE